MVITVRSAQETSIFFETQYGQLRKSDVISSLAVNAICGIKPFGQRSIATAPAKIDSEIKKVLQPQVTPRIKLKRVKALLRSAEEGSLSEVEYDLLKKLNAFLANAIKARMRQGKHFDRKLDKMNRLKSVVRALVRTGGEQQSKKVDMAERKKVNDNRIKAWNSYYKERDAAETEEETVQKDGMTVEGEKGERTVSFNDNLEEITFEKVEEEKTGKSMKKKSAEVVAGSNTNAPKPLKSALRDSPLHRDMSPHHTGREDEVLETLSAETLSAETMS